MNSSWLPKENYPSLAAASYIGIDVETCDPHLEDRGPGAIRKDGYICGFSVSTNDGFTGYYPIKHPSDNLPDPQKAIRWLKDQMTLSTPKVGANLLYDLIWLRCDLDIKVAGKLYDVQVAEPLLDENKSSYSLDSLAEAYLGQGKIDDVLYRVGIEILKLKPQAKKYIAPDEATLAKLKMKNVVNQVRGLLWKLPARYVGAYGEGDALLPIKIFELQRKKLEEQGLWKLFDEIETELIPMLLEMWLRGVPVDVAQAERVGADLVKRYDSMKRKMYKRTGMHVDIWSADSCAEACKKLGLWYPMTISKKPVPSFTAQWLYDQEHEFFKMLLEARQLDRGGSVFIEDKILGMEINGRIHPQFWQVRTDRYGTTSGRFSSSNPNAQQFPSRNVDLAPKIRSLLVAERGCKWMCADWSQQEPRLTIHYAYITGCVGAAEARQRFIDNPDTDYHKMVADLTELERKIAKTLNLGLSYSMGPAKFSKTYGFTLEESKIYYRIYHNKLPFIKSLSQQCERTARIRGYIKTLLGRHRHFNLWGPAKYEYDKGIVPKPYDEAIKLYGNPVVRYFAYRAMNALIQGGSADWIKKNMLDCYKAGFLPCLTVHDELDFCDIDSEKKVNDIRDCMMGSVKLEVPIKLDIDIGPSWGGL